MGMMQEKEAQVIIAKTKYISDFLYEQNYCHEEPDAITGIAVAVISDDGSVTNGWSLRNPDYIFFDKTIETAIYKRYTSHVNI
ncbi:MAG: hypothetical protein KAQ69_08135 [Spirochaetales bacterium]|nr:hypothetical protein [Spirochaetales bacterium]